MDEKSFSFAFLEGREDQPQLSIALQVWSSKNINKNKEYAFPLLPWEGLSFHLFWMHPDQMFMRIQYGGSVFQESGKNSSSKGICIHYKFNDTVCAPSEVCCWIF